MILNATAFWSNRLSPHTTKTSECGCMAWRLRLDDALLLVSCSGVHLTEDEKELISA
jgi:hypothetical protein